MQSCLFRGQLRRVTGLAWACGDDAQCNCRESGGNVSFDLGEPGMHTEWGLMGETGAEVSTGPCR